MQFKSTTGKLIMEFTNNPDADVKKLAKKYQTSPSYVYNIRKRTLERLAENPLTPEQNEAMDALVTTSQELGGWQETATTGALDVQVGGSHYKRHKIQPIEYIHANNLPFIEGNIVKYITRWREKNGLKDLEKIKHYVDLLIDLEKLQ
jgi:hypothetical protein